MFKLFKKRTTKTIIGLDSLYELPNRDSLNENELELLEEIKRRLYEILKQNKTIVSEELDFDGLYDSLLMNTDLLFNTTIGDEFKDKLKSSQERNDIVEMYKLKIYDAEIKKMGIDATLKFIALSEILKEKRFLFRPSKISAIKSAIDTLKNAIYIFKSQRQTIEIYIQNYLKNIENSKIEKNRQESYIIRKLSSVLIPKVHDAIVKDETTETYDVHTALLERELEIYAYKHKNDADKLEERLNWLYQHVDESDDKEKFKSKIEKLECEFLTLAKYGKKAITEEFMKTFYQVKFYIMTSDIETLTQSPFYPLYGRVNKIELEAYDKCIFDKIFEILNSGISTEILDQFKDFIKNDGKIDIIDILESKIKLGLIMCLNNKNRLDQFMNSPIPKKELSIAYNADYKFMVSFQEGLTLASVMELRNMLSGENDYDLKFLNYFWKPDKDDRTRYCLPEGIKKLTIDYKMCIDGETHFANSLKEKMRGKSLILPESLKDISLVNFDRLIISDIITKSNLESINISTSVRPLVLASFKIGKNISHIAIDCTAEEFDNVLHIAEITFKDFEDNKQLQEPYFPFFKKVFYLKDPQVTEYGPTPLLGIKEKPYKIIECRIGCRIPSFNFMDEDGNSVEVSPSYVLFSMKVRRKVPNPGWRIPEPVTDLNRDILTAQLLEELNYLEGENAGELTEEEIKEVFDEMLKQARKEFAHVKKEKEEKKIQQ